MIKITIAGDFATTDRGESAVLAKTAFSEEIVRLFQQSDLSIVNLEEPIALDKRKAIKKVGPNLSTIKESIPYLKECGIDVVTLANNHFLDYGKHGAETTIKLLKDNNLDYVGAGLTDNEKRRIYYHSDGDTRIAILNYCEYEFSIANGYGCNHMNPFVVYEDILEAKSKADVTIVITHGGHEGYNKPSPRMQELYRFFISAGADVVINHHQHCYSGYEEYKNGYIYYGLGNLFFDHQVVKKHEKGWNEGFILELIIEKRIIKDINRYPYRQCVGNNVAVELLKGDVINEFERDLDSLNKIVNNLELLTDNFQVFVEQQKKNYLTSFSPYTGRILKALCRRSLLPSFITKKKKLEYLNLFQCESHHDVCRTLLKEMQ